MLRMDCFAVTGIQVEPIRHFPPTEPDHEGFHTLEIQLRFNNGKDTFKIAAYADHPAHLAIQTPPVVTPRPLEAPTVPDQAREGPTPLA